MEQPDIELMSRAKTYLSGLPLLNQNAEYSKIVKLVNAYIDKHCVHQVVEDDIDISSESSKKIYYCKKCYTNFDSK
jgi:hypothetical protein